MWGPVLVWAVLELLAEAIDVEKPERAALDMFDRLRLREPFAEAFKALGCEGEEGWRVAARIKVVLLAGAGVGKEEFAAEPEPEATEAAAQAKADAKVESKAAPEVAAEDPVAADEERVALAPALWRDPDVRWLTGVHEVKGHVYLVRELYEELLWWLLMPSLLKLAQEPAPSRAEIVRLSETVKEALATAEAVDYRVDALLGTDETAEEEPEAEAPSPVEEPGVVDEKAEPVSEPAAEEEPKTGEDNPSTTSATK
jgi:hypothetical protein